MTADKRFLITTALEDTWLDDRPVLFLGKWCQLYARQERWSKIDAKVLPYHWDDRGKFYSDYLYLIDFYERALVDLATQLNCIHGTTHGLRYWRILVGPWLAYFVQILFDRWLSINAAANQFDIEGTIVISGCDDEMVPNDMSHFSELMISDIWNHKIYAYAIEFLESISIFKKEIIANKKNQGEGNKTSFKAKVSNMFGKIFANLARENDAFLIGTYLPYLYNWKLNFRLQQIPQLWRSEQTVKVDLDSQQRKWAMPDHARNDFEKFLLDMLPKQIPVVYLEGYSRLIDQTHKLPWPKNPKLIYTANVLWHDSLCMAYTAEKTENGTALVYGQHGGGYGTAKFHFAEDHEIAISDRYLRWGGRAKKKTCDEGISKVRGRISHSINAKKNLLFVTMTTPRYSFRLCAESAINYQDYTNNNFMFIKLVKESVLQNSIVRLSPSDNGRSQSAQWHDLFPTIVVDGGQRNISSLMKDARLVVSTYNQTAFLETLARGIPSVLFCDLAVTPLRETAIPYYDELRRVGIFHDTPASAADHVNRIWDDVGEWWTSDEVQIVLERFTERYCYCPDAFLEHIVSVFSESK
jgi:putative transferase (TIGR04331 family)